MEKLEIDIVLPGDINIASRTIHAGNKDRGFWDSPREIGTLLMLVNSELAEALEADRKGRKANLSKFYEDGQTKASFQENIKDTFEDEIADAMIRLLDLCGAMNIDICKHINAKLAYNATRQRKHGKKY